MNKDNNLDVLEQLNYKYGANLNVINNASHNKHYFGFSEYFGKNIFIKCYFSKKRFLLEKEILQSLKDDNLLDWSEIYGSYFIVLNFIDMRDMKDNDDIDAFEVGKLLGKFHENVTKENNITNIIDIVGDKTVFQDLSKLFKKLENHNQFIVLSKIYNVLLEFKSIYENEYNHLNKTVIHGDFGYRNIKSLNNKLTLIDFERVKYDIPWLDFIKIFNRELPDESSQKKCIEGYRKVKDLEIPSPLLVKVLEFYSVLGIYSYTSNIKDTKFEHMGNLMLEKILQYIKYIRILKSLILIFVGDALGVACTHYSREEISKVYGKEITDITEKIRYFGKKEPKWKLGEVTDDSYQAVATLKCYDFVDNPKRNDFSELIYNLDSKYCKNTTSCGRFKNSKDMNYVAWFGRGNRGINRSIPLGYMAYLCDWSDTTVIENVVKNVSLTHNSYETISAAIFIVSLIKNLLSMKKVNKISAFTDSLNTLLKYEKEMSRYEFSKALTYALYIKPEKYINEIYCKPSDWGFESIESVPIIVSVFINDNMSKDTMLNLINLGGDSDSTGAILGALMGAANVDLNLFSKEIKIISNNNGNLIYDANILFKDIIDKYGK
ncbi:MULTISPECIES: ADP-ribosylglycohydrolase family protein [unclassified Granulicatella]|uniref:ADP-ribosylglycohydrolase family protein n=1 Tax=unclassified Granulicatella TaxID=2630493 RepID=UPI0010741B5A|nr:MULTISPECIES: ADP-ribosylglycohydrolase family protein [unclassified Granulicatella]MBF0780792.1 ADP-ribosylglycohydrolase family protein [Granulicatella sp. 19428wC4_WM01]TFU93837.1 hypothetical protein E4T68_06740 [Granulicatella sp. WM01]